jgi:hypothetical protein
MSHTFLWCQIMVSSLFHHSKKGHSSVPQIPMHKEGHSIMCDGILLKALGRIDLQHTHTHTYTHTNTHTHTHTHKHTHTHTKEMLDNRGGHFQYPQVHPSTLLFFITLQRSVTFSSILLLSSASPFLNAYVLKFSE